MRAPRRFDDVLMTPPDPVADVDADLLGRLRAWCEDGAFPALTEPLSVTRVAATAGLDGVACALDGSHELQRLGRWRGLAWRLQLQARECVSSRPARRADPWDCGWWREGTLDHAEAFRPRRATLLMVRERDPSITATLLAKLQSSCRSYANPLRVLIVESADS
ncbi:hypothetical protein [Roseateles sp.]|uniref:hypothetical protein n=1 Tax=Roseateles sp. TaxID=1971397 RepID=UPI0031D88E60